MDDHNILLVKILGLVEGFIQKLCLPADSVNLTFSKDIKLFQDKYSAKVETSDTTDLTLMRPAAKKMKSDDKTGRHSS
ncbi:hypothetical protein OS493_022622 [Desmophyllum pertusum]|uniref:Uncharacterized protein n=1 Tax=Desmophyllum pertusum TaxID=174260 RepID=A0A9X0CL66_9CNID|nr:hypothetical protein OS493_022622 [Desmophyllum pertusum]